MHLPLSYFLIRPKYWLGLFLFLIVSLIAKLPIVIQIKFANVLGWLMLKLAKRRRLIAETNLKLCFPEKSNSERKALLAKNFQLTALGLIESASTWFTDLNSRKKNTQITGLEHIDKALKKGKGVILLSFHMTTLEIGGALFCEHYKLWPMYKPNKNLLIETVMRQGRLRHAESLLRRNDLRATVKALKSNKIVWYATDQNYGGKKAVFVPFFGIQAATITATTKFAKLTGATVVPFTQKRINDGKQFLLEIHPALENFPGTDEVEDATRINLFLENYLKENPADYMWLHQRFRSRPEGEANIYTRSA